MFSSRRLPHAIIIEGERGLLRHKLAGIIAAYSVCSGENRPCGGCRECRLAEKSIHPDITIISPDGAAIKVDQIRRIRKDTYILPNQAEKRVFVIDEAERMNESAQNALLKVLEEPPEFTEFILITASASALLPTITSRSVTFSLMPVEESIGCRYITENYPEFSPDAAEKAVESSGGNIGAALYLLKNDDLKDDIADRILISADTGDELELLKAFQPLISSKKREDTDKALNSLLTKLQRLISLKAVSSPKARELPGGGIAMRRLVKMERDVKDAISRQTLNPGLALLLTNLCACFKSDIDV